MCFRFMSVILCLLAVFNLRATNSFAAEIPTVEAYFGFRPGADGELLDYEQLIHYLQALDAESDRLELREAGQSPLGRPMYAAFFSSPGNLARLDALKEINRQLALDSAIRPSRRETLINEGRVFVMVTLSMHSEEVGPSQSLPLWAYELVTTHDPDLLARLDEVVLMIVPCHNPDGMDMIVEHYRKYKGTPYEGSSMPGVYHQYVGHDNNRDFITLTQADTQVINRLYSTEWYPQVLTEKHQMGSTGPRYFVPPNHDPIAENIDQGMWRWCGVFGSLLARDMGRDGLTGIAQHWAFDNYWPGSTETALWKNVISMLTEAASCKVAQPVFIEPNELKVRGKGLAEYKKSINMPDPWPGGWWRLGDIIAYELSSLHSLLRTSAEHRVEILRFRNEACCAEVERGRSEPPYYFVLPATQPDRKELIDLVRLLDAHGVSVARLTKRIEIDSRVLSEGDFVISLSQPYRPFIKEVMESQKYPERHYTPGGEIIHPYDITSWSLPLHRGVRSIEVSSQSPELEASLSVVEAGELSPSIVFPETCWALAYSSADNSGFMAAFGALQKGVDVERVTHPLALERMELPTGSFLLRYTQAGRADLEAIAASVPSAPVFIENPIEIETLSLSRHRIALVETWSHDMDAGWTRFVFDSYRIPFEVIRPGDFASIEFSDRFDVVVFPDAGKDLLLKGKPSRDDERYHFPDYPPEYAKGMGDEGMEKLMAFLDQGGIIIAWRSSVPLFLEGLKIKRAEKEYEEFDLPVTDLSKKAKEKGLSVPGSFLRIKLIENHPLSYGMPGEAGVFSRGTPVLQTSLPIFDMDRRVIAAFPDEKILLSGYAQKEEELANRPAMVWVRKGRGQLVLMSFNPQFRASTPVTYKLLFNALMLEKEK
ncbi:MAG: M14 metallopeptidase family protein [Planctomycetota bacterium]